MIYAVCGKLGGGKSLSCVCAMVNHIRNGGYVVTNIALNLENISRSIRQPLSRVKSLYLYIDANSCNPELFPHGDLRGTPNGRRVICVIDESAEWFSSLDSAKSMRQWISWLRHSDKLGTDIFFIVQDLSMLNKQGRLLINRMIVCIDMAKFKFPIIRCQPFFWLKSYIRLVEHDAITKEVIGVSWLHKNKEIFSYYNTADLFGLTYFSSSNSAYVSVVPRHYSYHLKGKLQWIVILTVVNAFLLVILILL